MLTMIAYQIQVDQPTDQPLDRRGNTTGKGGKSTQGKAVQSGVITSYSIHYTKLYDYGKYIARDEDIPFIRWGFPILDRQGHQYFPTVGYKGGLRFLEKVLNALLDRVDRDASEIKLELVY